MAAIQQHPIDILQVLETRGRETAHKLPQTGEQKPVWRGIGFRIGDLNLVSPVSQIVEIMRFPKLTSVPNTLSWIKGLANFRGKLMTVIDLAAFLGYSPAPNPASSRILLIQQNNVLAGIMVNEILGLKHFDPAKRLNTEDTGKPLKQIIAAKLYGAFEQNNDIWHVFDMNLLATDAEFLQASDSAY